MLFSSLKSIVPELVFIYIYMVPEGRRFIGRVLSTLDKSQVGFWWHIRLLLYRIRIIRYSTQLFYPLLGRVATLALSRELGIGIGYGYT
jgi:hypothetical protein